MKHRQTHRGLAPADARLFAERQWPALRAAASDFCWLLDRGYASHSALELVGNRHTLASRQRMALTRYACPQEAVARRLRSQLQPSALKGQELWLDGYNLLTVLESALSGGIVLIGRDGCCRDIAGIHRRYRKVNETIPVLKMVGEVTQTMGVTVCRWLLDKPVSNSGRLKALILAEAKTAGWNMEVELHFSPDHVLAHTDQVIATSDGIVLERCKQWVNLAAWIIKERITSARVLDLSVCQLTPDGK